MFFAYWIGFSKTAIGLLFRFPIDMTVTGKLSSKKFGLKRNEMLNLRAKRRKLKIDELSGHSMY